MSLAELVEAQGRPPEHSGDRRRNGLPMQISPPWGHLPRSNSLTGRLRVAITAAGGPGSKRFGRPYPPGRNWRGVILYPAIDLKQGAVVRLRRGEMRQATVFNRDPADQARRFAEAGAGSLHLVDLDGAFAGKPINRRAVEAILAAVRIPCQLGGGIRDAGTLDSWLEAGVPGSSSARRRSRTRLWCARPAGTVRPDRRRGRCPRGRVTVEGWAETGEVTALDCPALRRCRVAALVFADVDRDSLLAGVDVFRHGHSRRSADPCYRLGGVAGLGELTALKAAGVAGVVGGRALYDRRIDLREALGAAPGAGPVVPADAEDPRRPLPRCRSGARREGRRFRRSARSRRSGGQAAVYDNARADAALLLDISATRRTAISCWMWWPARPSAASCRSPSAAGCAASRTSAACCWRGRQGLDQHRRRGRARARPPRGGEVRQPVHRRRGGRQAGPRRRRQMGGLHPWRAQCHRHRCGGICPRVAGLGAGEILLTSMDRDGTKLGYDLALTRAVADAVSVPVIASGGVGTLGPSGGRRGRGPCQRAAGRLDLPLRPAFHRRGQGDPRRRRHRGARIE